jgi:hypothetical protein
MGVYEEVIGLNANYISTSSLSSFPYPIQQTSGSSEPTKIYSMTFNNVAAAVRYVKIMNTSATTAVFGISTVTPFMRIAMAAGSNYTYTPPAPLVLSEGLSVFATSTADDASNGAVVAGDVHGFIIYS